MKQTNKQTLKQQKNTKLVIIIFCWLNLVKEDQDRSTRDIDSQNE